MALSTHPRTIPESLHHFFAGNGKIGLAYGTGALTRLALYGITLATVTRDEVWVLDGANSFEAYWVARLARQWNYSPETILSRIRLSRAFTCYQLSELLTRRLSPMHTPSVIVCLGLVETFYDEDVPMTEAVRLLNRVLARLKRLAQDGHTIFITACEPRSSERRALLTMVRTVATHAWRIDAIVPQPTMITTQLALLAE